MASWATVGEEMARSRASSPQSDRRIRSNASGWPSPLRTERGQRATSSATASLEVLDASCDGEPAAARLTHPPALVFRSD